MAALKAGVTAHKKRQMALQAQRDKLEKAIKEITKQQGATLPQEKQEPLVVIYPVTRAS